MDRSLIIRALGLYLPLVLATALTWHKVRTHRQIATLLAGLCWSSCSLLLLQILNQQFLWWRFHAVGGLLRGMPVDLYLGWVLLWGCLPSLILPRAPIWTVACLFLALDLALMPACRPVVELSRTWLVGEAVALVLVLVPAALFSRWTADNTQLEYRSLLWAVPLHLYCCSLCPKSFLLRRAMAGGRLYSIRRVQSVTYNCRSYPCWQCPRFPQSKSLRAGGTVHLSRMILHNAL
jgi:hypothetical protein